MRAYQVTGTTLQSLQRVELPDPDAGPGLVVVRLRFAALNYRDLVMLRGTYGPRQASPFIPLSDGAGEVVGVGAGVTRVGPGDRVVLQYVRDWIGGEPTAESMRARLGGPLDGTLAELIAVPEHAVVKLPARLSTEDAATLPVAGTAAWHALFDFGQLQPGQTVVVQGTGGVSIFALQLARAAGARVLVTSRGLRKAALVRELGASALLDTLAEPDWDRQVLEHTGGRGADLVLDVVGGTSVSRSLRATRVGGRVALIGFLESMEATVDLRVPIQRRIDLRGVSVGPRASLEALVSAMAAQRLRPLIGARFGFDDAVAAFEKLERADHAGKIVIALP